MSALILMFFGIFSTNSSIEKTMPVNSNFKIETTYGDSTQTDIKMEIKGLYEHRNLFVSNPILANGKRCITKAPELNGIPTAKVTDGNAFEIKLSEYELELGEVIQLVIWHSPECKPVLINPEVIDPAN